MQAVHHLKFVWSLFGPPTWYLSLCKTSKTRRLPREDPRTEVGEEVHDGVGVRVGPMEFS